MDAEAKVRSARRVAMGGPVSVHDCAITQRSIVLLDLPVTFSMDAAASGASFPYRWQEGYRSRIGLLPRDGESTDVVWHDVEPCYVFHPMNAFDDPDGRRHRARRGAPSLHVPHELPRARRGAPDAGAVASRRSRGRGQGGAARRPGAGVPTGRRAPRRPAHRYGYAGRRGDADDILGTESVLLRHDFERGTSQARSFGRGASLGEAVFVPRPTTPTRPTAGCSCSSTRPTPAPPPCTSSTPTTSRVRRRPSSSCRSVCRRDSTAIGCPTRPDLVSVAPGPHAGYRSRRVRLAMGPAAPAPVGHRAGPGHRRLRRRDGLGPRVPHRVVAGGPARGAAHLPAGADQQGDRVPPQQDAGPGRLHLPHQRRREPQPGRCGPRRSPRAPP